MEHKTCRTLRVVAVRLLNGGEQFLLTLENPGFSAWKPGQFVMIRPVSWGFEMVWARPVSIAWCDEHGLTLVVRRAGRGTARMAGLAPGDEVTLWGPLGTSFVTDPAAPTLLLAGGIGLAPFWGYAARHPAPENLHLLFGHTLPLDAFPMEPFASLGKVETFYQQTAEQLGEFVALLEARVADFAAREKGLVLACGPGPFLRTVHRLALAHGVRCQLSLENRMACGIGACLGCVATDASGHRVQSCTRGPVFWATDLSPEF
ncbi:Dihydroorotate dehydrogenase, electron transfer subunit [Desulfovibrio sp. X2]|uniref:iron-sulfur cluster-binding protein n=1 Tax=Desulfovibrio sp. X2 TaxID=941449 RepID=UPI000358C572|nr:dihydroorotate dehydrogenase [Desulfovibrio sp. X2]EPR38714.1 Dihydroorotate dehydrogenase, electron transfer subunit [Desulfovibrio sp. X2]